MPGPRSVWRESFGLANEEYDLYREFRRHVPSHGEGGRMYRMFGHPDSIQRFMHRPFQFSSCNAKHARGVLSYYEHSRAAELVAVAYDWPLLLPIEPDETPGAWWGANGPTHFWTHRQNLAEADLTKSWMFVQCYWNACGAWANERSFPLRDRR